MVLDLSHVTQVVQDTLRAADEYALHDPDLASELALRAYDICREFGIDVASLEAGDKSGSRVHFGKMASKSLTGNSAGGRQASNDEIVADEQSQLFHILDLQKTIVQDQPTASESLYSPETRSIWSGWRISNPFVKAQAV